MALHRVLSKDQGASVSISLVKSKCEAIALDEVFFILFVWFGFVSVILQIYIVLSEVHEIYDNKNKRKLLFLCSLDRVTETIIF